MQKVIYQRFICQKFVSQKFVSQKFDSQKFVSQKVVMQKVVMQKFVCLLLLLFSNWIVAGETVTLKSLLNDMTSMENLSRFPSPHFKTVQFSSFDRRAKAPYKPGWYSNADGFGWEPIPGFVKTVKEPGKNGIGTYLLAEVNGPGAIVRTWTAAISGKIQLILDGSKDCIYDGGAKFFLDNPYAAIGGDKKLLGDQNGFNQREAGYFPISFAKKCRILWTGSLKQVHFYQVQIRCYDVGSRVKTFCSGDLKTYAGDIKRASELLANPKKILPLNVKTDTEFSLTIGANERKTVFKMSPGTPQAISYFSVKVEAKDIAAALRKTVLRMYFDASPSPQVETPLGDFFGAAPGICPYVSVPFIVEPEGKMISRFVMPFARSVRIEAENWSGDSIKINCGIKVSGYRWEEGKSMYFFANWKVDHQLLAKRANEVFDLPYLCARGKGVYVGTAAIIMNPTPVPTPSGGWWGEGDEKIWVDDDVFPSTFGTGSEDYFNYAWSVPDIFTHAYFAQPLTTGPGNRGYVVNNRWHIIDSLPFERNIFFFMELFTHRPTPGLSYARLCYYYAFGNLRDDRVQLRPENMYVPALPEWKPLAAGACRNASFIQGEDLKVEGSTGGIVRCKMSAMCAGGKFLSWNVQAGKAAKNELDLGFEIKKAGKYRIALTLVRSPGSDHISVFLDGRSIFKAADYFNISTPYLTLLRSAIGDRVFDLKPGKHNLKVKSLDSKGKSAAQEVGIDFIWLIKT